MADDRCRAAKLPGQAGTPNGEHHADHRISTSKHGDHGNHHPGRPPPFRRGKRAGRRQAAQNRKPAAPSQQSLSRSPRRPLSGSSHSAGRSQFRRCGQLRHADPMHPSILRQQFYAKRRTALSGSPHRALSGSPKRSSHRPSAGPSRSRLPESVHAGHLGATATRPDSLLEFNSDTTARPDCEWIRSAAARPDREWIGSLVEAGARAFPALMESKPGCSYKYPTGAPSVRSGRTSFCVMLSPQTGASLT